MEIASKSVLVTGANRGIGLAMSKAFAKEGARLLLCARNPKEINTQQFIQLGAARVDVFALDLSSLPTIEKFVKKLLNEKIRVDILVNNAGLLAGGLLETQDIAKVYDLIQVNLTAYIHLTARILPQMLKRKSGKIINNASISGILNLPSATVYTASKSGVVAFGRSLEQELNGSGVSTLLLITPGVETDMYKQVRKIYSSNYSVSSGGTISAEAWAIKVIKAVKDDRKELWSGSLTEVVGRIYQIFPQAVKIGTSRIFKRT